MRALRLYAFLGSLAALAACPGEAVDDGGGAGGPASATFGSSACGTCVQQACTSQLEACATDPGCAGHLDCLFDCPTSSEGDADAACEEACPDPQSATGKNAVAALSACRSSGPGGDCAACGAVATPHPILDQDCAPSSMLDACDKCEAENCCETSCDPACGDYVSCMMGCNDMPCRDACAAASPEGVSSFGKWLGCSVALCRPACQRLIIGGCLECGVEACTEQWADCLGNSDCYLRFLCGSFCGDFDEACYGDCEAQYPAAAPFWGAFLLCVGDHCLGTACSGGPEL